MKVLYVSSNHSTLEYDDLTMLSEMGIEWFSTGVYMEPNNPLHSLVTRVPIVKVANSKYVSLFKKENPSYIAFENALITLPKELVDEFDIVWITHTFPNLVNNWEYIKHKPVIWRTYNQQDVAWEVEASQYVKEGLKIVRMGNTESNRIHYAGQDAVIRAYVDSTVFSGWTGKDRSVLTYHNRFDQRLRQGLNNCTKSYLKLRSVFKCFELYGFGDGINGISNGPLRYTEQVQKYRDSRIYLSLNSESAVYTNSFMEALMTGIPVVTFGSKTSNVMTNPELLDSYEVPYIVTPEVDAIVSDDIDYLYDQITQLLKNKEYRQQIGSSGRAKALQLFDKNVIMGQWKSFLDKI